MTDIITRCPECKIAFRAQPSQLTAAAGLVRCGGCLVVFKAEDYQEQPDANDINVDYLPYVLDGIEDLNGATDYLERELDAVLGDSLDAEKLAAHNTKFAELLDEMLEKSAPVDERLFLNQHLEDFELDDLDGEADQVQAENKVSDLAHQEILATDSPIQSPARAKLLPMLGTVLLGATVLALQLVYFNSEHLSQIPKYRPLIQQFCLHTKCTVGEYRNLREINVTRFVVRTDPNQLDTISMDILLVNKADIIQRFPKLKISFTDLNDSLVATRTFLPLEYLQDKLGSHPLMPSQQEVRINLKLVDPGLAATGYLIQLAD